jgi:hypothetical protein
LWWRSAGTSWTIVACTVVTGVVGWCC